MSRKNHEVLEVITPKISLTIGNPEIVNMLVQARVRELKSQLAVLDVQLEEATKLYSEQQPLLRSQIQKDIQTTFGKKAEATRKALATLSGKKVVITHDFESTPSWDRDPGFLHLTSSRIRNQYASEPSPWSEKHVIPSSVQIRFDFHEVPPADEIKDEMQSGCTKEEAIFSILNSCDPLCALDDLTLVYSDAVKAVIKEARELDNARNAIVAKRGEILGLLGDTSSVEKEILAKMTQNTLESNPELAAAFGVLCHGIGTLSADSVPALPALTVE